MVVLRVLSLLCALTGFSWYQFFNIAPARVLIEEALDPFGSRPVRSVLFVGNSRMYAHGMPYMVRAIADSAGSPYAWRLRMHARPGETLERHWKKGRVATLLGAQRWDGVVLQAESGAHFEANHKSFAAFGRKLIDEARRRDVPVSLVVGWVYGPAAYPSWSADDRARYFGHMRRDHRALARDAGARLIHVGEGWRRAAADGLRPRLDSDGNHPSLHGSYLTALLIYAHLSGADPELASYAPATMPDDEARAIRAFAGRYVRSGAGA